MTPARHAEILPALAVIIEHLRSTDPDSWWAGPTYRSPDGNRHCALAHIEQRWGIDAMNWFEDRWSTSYVIGAVNDGPSERYPQPHPRERVIAYLEALEAGREDDTQTSMDKCYALGEPS